MTVDRDDLGESVHDRARRLLLASLVEGTADRGWLEEHLAECPACAALGRRLDEELRALRLGEVMASPWLVEATQRRLRARALSLAAEGPSWAVVAATAVGFVIALLTLWVSWRAFGVHFGLPASVTVLAVALLWLLPTSVGTLLAVLFRPLSTQEVRR